MPIAVTSPKASGSAGLSHNPPIARSTQSRTCELFVAVMENAFRRLSYFLAWPCRCWVGESHCSGHGRNDKPSEDKESPAWLCD